MADGWENQYGFDLYDSNDASLDYDLDGYSNYKEYVAGTDPKDPSSKPGKTYSWDLQSIDPTLIILMVVGFAAIVLILVFLVARKRRTATT
jgi:hypothetical protein